MKAGNRQTLEEIRTSRPARPWLTACQVAANPPFANVRSWPSTGFLAGNIVPVEAIASSSKEDAAQECVGPNPFRRQLRERAAIAFRIAAILAPLSSHGPRRHLYRINRRIRPDHSRCVEAYDRLIRGRTADHDSCAVQLNSEIAHRELLYPKGDIGDRLLMADSGGTGEANDEASIPIGDTTRVRLIPSANVRGDTIARSGLRSRTLCHPLPRFGAMLPSACWPHRMSSLLVPANDQVGANWASVGWLQQHLPHELRVFDCAAATWLWSRNQIRPTSSVWIIPVPDRPEPSLRLPDVVAAWPNAPSASR